MDDIFKHLSWPTICEMIEQLAETQNADATAFRTALESYITRVWPDKEPQYQKYRESNPSLAQTMANDIHHQ
ncbi:MAG TPA: hypothetical protein ENH62_17500 [Marinobacter sp.]|nr:hypothetical protein [Marinobacter sp.]